MGRSLHMWMLRYEECKPFSTQLIETHSTVVVLAISPDGNVVATGSLFDKKKEIIIKLKKLKQSFQKIQILASESASGSNTNRFCLLSGRKDGCVSLWRSIPSKLIEWHHQEAVTAAAIDDSGLMVASAAQDGSVSSWNLKTGTHLRPIAVISSQID